MKLFAPNEVIKTDYTLEQFLSVYNSSSVVSMEAVSDYLFKMKDMLNNTFTAILPLDGDKLANDCLASRFEVEHVIKRLKFSDAAAYTVPKPENFKGMYVDYTTDLMKHAEVLNGVLDVSIDKLKLVIANFMNEYSEDNIDKLPYRNVFNDLDKINKAAVKDLSKYYPKPDHSVKANIKHVIRNFNDVRTLNINITELSKLINTAKIKELNKKAENVSDLIDLMLEYNKTSNILLTSNSIKKDLTDSIYVTGKAVETYGYIYSNMLLMYTANAALHKELLNIEEKHD